MMYFNRYQFFIVLCNLVVFDSVFCGDIVYEYVSPYLQDSNIIDPNSLYYDRNSQSNKVPNKYKSAETGDMVVRGSSDYQSYCRDSHYEVFARRLVNMLISRSNLKSSNGMVLGKIDLEATNEEVELLRIFGEGKLSVREIDSIISNVLRQSEIGILDEALNYTDKLSIYLYKHRVIFGAMLLTIFVIIIALKVRWTRWRIIFLIFDIMVIISFMLTWWELLQEAEIKLAAQQRIFSSIPDECRKDKIDFFSSFSLFFGFGKGDCLKYFEAVMTDPVLKVTPMHAFSHMITKFFFHPLALAGHFLSDFVENLTKNLPFPVNYVAKLLLIMFMPSLLFGLMFVSLGGAMQIRLGPFLHVYLHGRQSIPPSNSLMNNDRQAVEIIRSDIREVTETSSNGTEVEIVITSTETSTERKRILPKKKISPKKKKVEECDINSEEFPEEREYEKISKIKLEEEISQAIDAKVQNDNLKSNENSKQSLEIKTEDSKE